MMGFVHFFLFFAAGVRNSIGVDFSLIIVFPIQRYGGEGEGGELELKTIRNGWREGTWR